jgi:hypothetical protein
VADLRVARRAAPPIFDPQGLRSLRIVNLIQPKIYVGQRGVAELPGIDVRVLVKLRSPGTHLTKDLDHGFCQKIA